mgnify:CR=1 FL=1|jgi:LEA14-like dessication related protein
MRNQDPTTSSRRTMLHTLARLGVVSSLALLGGCAALTGSDPLRVNVVGIEPLQGAGLELRLAVKLRLQNPNETPVEFDGTALDLEVNGRTLATGVSDQKGVVPRFGETLLTVPVTISAFNALRQALALADGKAIEELPYVLRGKLAGGALGAQRFTHEGSLSLSALGKTK